MLYHLQAGGVRLPPKGYGMRFLAVVEMGLAMAMSSNAVATTVTRMPLPALVEFNGKGWGDRHRLSPDAFDGKPMIVAFWRQDCLPCLAEIKALPNLTKAHGDIEVILLNLDGPKGMFAHLPQTLPANIHVTAPAQPLATEEQGDLLVAFGDRWRALPYNMARHADETRCAGRAGALGDETLAYWSRKC